MLYDVFTNITNVVVSQEDHNKLSNCENIPAIFNEIEIKNKVEHNVFIKKQFSAHSFRGNINLTNRCTIIESLLNTYIQSNQNPHFFIHMNTNNNNSRYNQIDDAQKIINNEINTIYIASSFWDNFNPVSTPSYYIFECAYPVTYGMLFYAFLIASNLSTNTDTKSLVITNYEHLYDQYYNGIFTTNISKNKIICYFNETDQYDLF
jgi:hypothetical protein